MKLTLTNGILQDAAGHSFDPHTLSWNTSPQACGGKEMDEVDAVRWLRTSATPVRPPVAVIGPREATDAQRHMAREVGGELAMLGLTVLCGGRQGVMDAVCQGVADHGGLSVGLLPEGDWTSANAHVTIPVATGIGIARNALIARAALAVIAIGGGLGTLSEIALSLQFGKPVFTLCEAPIVPGSHPYPDFASLCPALCRAVLALPV